MKNKIGILTLIMLAIFGSSLSAMTVNGTGNVAVPVPISSTMTFDRIGVYVSTAVNPSECRMGLYTDSGIYPSNLIVDGGTTLTSTTGTKTVTISQQLTPALYWMAITCNSAVSLGTFGGASCYAPVGFASLSTAPTGMQQATFSYAALPDPFPSAYAGYSPCMTLGIRRSA
jgi:hypothetical protein